MSRSIIRIIVPRLVGNCCGLPSEYLLEMVLHSNGVQYGVRMGPKWLPRGLLELLAFCLGASWKGSWRALGTVLGGLGPLTKLETALGRPEATEEIGFSIAWRPNTLGEE